MWLIFTFENIAVLEDSGLDDSRISGQSTVVLLGINSGCYAFKYIRNSVLWLTCSMNLVPSWAYDGAMTPQQYYGRQNVLHVNLAI